MENSTTLSWIAKYSTAFLNNPDLFVAEHNLYEKLFYFDVFVSHKNPNKLAKYLTVTLAKRGLFIWHDTICGIYSNNIVNNISKALRNSRFIFVVISSNDKKLSKWVKAEILPSLFFEKSEKQERIIVIQEDESVPIPLELINHRKFCLSKGESEYLLVGKG